MAAAFPELGSRRLTWVSPLEEENFEEHYDARFLAKVGLGDLAGDLGRYWPEGGPHWDALAVAEGSGGVALGVVLVEAKSYPEEMYAAGCAASPKSRRKIEAALAEAKRWLGVGPDCDWTGPLYQFANRIAHLYFLREVTRVPAWLVNVCIVDDPYPPVGREPTSEARWREALNLVKCELGLAGIDVPFAAEIFLNGTRM